jgi:hypothetical protein
VYLLDKQDAELGHGEGGSGDHLKKRSLLNKIWPIWSWVRVPPGVDVLVTIFCEKMAFFSTSILHNLALF